MRKAIITLIIAVLLLWVGAYLWSEYSWRQFVRSVKHHADPNTVQKWADGLMQQHEQDSEIYYDREGTYLPPGIAEVHPRKPSVYFMPKDDHVVIGWGRSGPVILVGSSTFMFTNNSAEMWISGVYLMNPKED